jgi:hypothetical protein
MPLVTVSASTGANGHPVYLITLSSPPDHRLSPALIAEFHDVLDSVEADWRAKRKEAQKAGDKKKKVGGTVIIRGEGEKFFSNGEREARVPGVRSDELTAIAMARSPQGSTMSMPSRTPCSTPVGSFLLARCLRTPTS